MNKSSHPGSKDQGVLFMGCIGLDEAGRGPWAGPLVASAVKLSAPISGLADSKQLSAKQRDRLYDQILQTPSEIGVGWVSAAEIDRLGLQTATQQAMEQAISQIEASDQAIIIDGNINYLPDHQRVKTLVKADQKVMSVAAASIVAKVSRDRYMADLETKYPGFGFASHKGYGTKAHQQALSRYGVTPQHRKSFKPIQKLL